MATGDALSRIGVTCLDRFGDFQMSTQHQSPTVLRGVGTFGLDVIRQMDSMFGRALGVVIQLLSMEDLDLLVRGARAMLDALERAHSEQVAD